MELIIDDREKHVIEFIDSASQKYKIKCTIKRLEIGDFAICYKNHILLIIERKTWKDLSASLRDGRKNNVEKLITLRNKTKCQIAYLIEGKIAYKPDYKIARIPYKNLRAHLDHLAFRDTIHMIQTGSVSDTASRLCELCQNFLTNKELLKRVSTTDTTNGTDNTTIIGAGADTTNGNSVEVIGAGDETKEEKTSVVRL